MGNNDDDTFMKKFKLLHSDYGLWVFINTMMGFINLAAIGINIAKNSNVKTKWIFWVAIVLSALTVILLLYQVS